MRQSNNADEQLATLMGECALYPLRFVDVAYDWGHGDLEAYDGLDTWQYETMDRWGFEIRKRGFDRTTSVTPIQFATSSGHGVGKSALTAIIIDYIMSTRPNCKGIVTANTFPQLKTKTWAELDKWTRRCITAHWFNLTSSTSSMCMYHKDNPTNWRTDALTCSKENSESFAGNHAADSTSFYIFDEASAIAKEIWEVAQGGLTDGEPFFFAFGNGTRSSGQFFEAFHKMQHRYITRRVDSRTSKFANKTTIQQWIDDYGLDSDFVKVRVLGDFPSVGSCQFLSYQLFRAAMERQLRSEIYEHMPKIMAVDVARFGDDQTIFARRQGRKLYNFIKHRGLDTMQVAAFAAQEFANWRGDYLLVDGDGLGAGVVDRLNQLGFPVIEIHGQATPNDKKKYYNKRAEMYGNLREWSKGKIEMPFDQGVVDACGLEYGFTGDGQIKLESKDDFKARGFASPDEMDAIAYTFGVDIFEEQPGLTANTGYATQSESEYDVLEYGM